MRRNDYIALMSRVLDAYTPERMRELCDRTRAEGITEHGVPRLCANIGILIANGFRTGLLPFFEEMMDLCCEGVCDPHAAERKTGNEFSVKELVLCLLEVERAGILPRARTEGWREALSRIRPVTAYHYIAAVPPVRINNWAAFAAASEQMRKYAGLADEDAFIRNQVASQILSLDENGMYRDPHEPMLYDLMTRLQLLVCLRFGYDGGDRALLEGLLSRAADFSLFMQSTTGEIPFGGRSAQFLFNEPCLAAIFEYEAARLHAAGEEAGARSCKAAAALAMETLRDWLSQDELRHCKNRFPQTDPFGCEGYGYFDKYMITTASNLYKCALFCDDGIETPEPAAPATAPAARHTGAHFHKVFARAGEYFCEYDTAADPQYDASGLGRVHRRGVPSALCLTVPFAKKPRYSLCGAENPAPLSLCPVLFGADGGEIFLCAPGCTWTRTEEAADAAGARLGFEITGAGAAVRETCAVTPEGVTLHAEADGETPLARAIPAFSFDGRGHTRITLSADRRTLTTEYRGCRCTCTTDGEITPTGRLFLNRSGEYLLFLARGTGAVTVRITLDAGGR